MNWKEYIVSDKNILGGKPSIRGTRLSVEFILERLSDGWTDEMLFENYPSLTKEALQAVYAFALGQDTFRNETLLASKKCIIGLYYNNLITFGNQRIRE